MTNNGLYAVIKETEQVASVVFSTLIGFLLMNERIARNFSYATKDQWKLK